MSQEKNDNLRIIDRLHNANKLLGQIAEGWRNNLIPPEEIKDVIKKVSEQRLFICSTCEYHSRFHNVLYRPDDHCTHCGCTLSAKTACLSCKCPLEEPKWDVVQ